MARRAANGVVYTGPFFEGDPAKRVGQNMAEMVKEISDEAASMMRSQFTSGRASELAPTIASRDLSLRNRTYSRGVYSTMTGPDSRSPNPHSWVTFAETGRRRVNGTTVQTRFRGFKQWAKVRSSIRRHIKDEKIRQGIVKGVA